MYIAKYNSSSKNRIGLFTLHSTFHNTIITAPSIHVNYIFPHGLILVVDNYASQNSHCTMQFYVY